MRSQLAHALTDHIDATNEARIVEILRGLAMHEYIPLAATRPT